MIQPNPMSEYIAAYASGALSEGMSLLVGAHLTYSAERRREAAFYESISGALLDAEPSEPGPSLDATLALLDAPERARPAPLPFDPEMPLPVPVRQALAEAGDEIRWRFRLPGVHEHQLAGQCRITPMMQAKRRLFSPAKCKTKASFTRAVTSRLPITTTTISPA